MFNFLPLLCFLLLSFLETSTSSVQLTGKLQPGFKGSAMAWIDNDGMFLLSNNSEFSFGLTPTHNNVNLFLLVVMHHLSKTVVWAANTPSPVHNSDDFVFGLDGNAYLLNQGSTIWSTHTANKGASAMALLDSGNLVLMGKEDDGTYIWQSFRHPTNTLLSNQNFSQGMKLTTTYPNSNPSYNLTYSLHFQSGNIILFADFNPPQPYWSMGADHRKTINKPGGDVSYALLTGTSWKFYDSYKVLLWQFIFPEGSNENATWAAVLGDDGYIKFIMLQGASPNPSVIKVPQDECSRPTACDPYSVCYPGVGIRCQCPQGITCKSPQPPAASCNTQTSIHSVDLLSVGDILTYSPLGYVEPFSNTSLDGCKASCLKNCSCGAMFYDDSSGKCFMFNAIGSLEGSVSTTANFTSYVKIYVNRAGSRRKSFIVIILIVVAALIICLFLVGFRYYKRSNKAPEAPKDGSEEENFLEGLSGMPIRFSYADLVKATNSFGVKLGQGGFGSVYQGSLPDGSQVAVKKLEGIGQGTKEFRAEVSIIGSIHHLHLVRLKGFCAEGSHRLLVYEFMANGSLDKWLFKKGKLGESVLDWETRYNIAVGTAKGLAYLHEDCDAKIVHCDIKPENVLLDDQFMAKVSDFGLAKLMNREQSHVFTTLRGTRGYLAPEWITNYAISEKSDVYSYGMVLLELIGGRKNYDPKENSEKCHLPSYAFKMMEEGKLSSIMDARLKLQEGGDEKIEIAIKVALWCIQDDMQLRPPMTKVVQMLEGVCTVPHPPVASQLGSRLLYSNLFKSASEGGISSGPSDCNSDTYISAVRLSGPR